MSSKKKAENKSLRFGIVDENGLRAATWHLRSTVCVKTNLPEVYLFCRELGDSIHASMHPSGRWHIKYPDKFFEAEIRDISPTNDQYIQKWDRPKELKPGITLAFLIVTPASAVITEAGNLKESLVKIPNAPKGQATNIEILFIDRRIRKVRNAGIVGELTLSNGERVLVTHRVGNILPPFEKIQAQPRFLKGKSKKDLQDGNVKAIVLGDAIDGSRIIWDSAVEMSSKE